MGIYLNDEKTKIVAQILVSETICSECKIELLDKLLVTEIELPKKPATVCNSEKSLIDFLGN